MAAPSETEAAQRIAAYKFWYHSIEVAPGVATPGVHDSPSGLAVLDSLGLPADCTGMRALDVGARDGFYSFELERRGAEVTAIDYADPKSTGFPIAAELLGSRLRCEVCNVYDVTRERHGTFDLVMFLGLLYHLRNPLLALDRIRDVMRDGGLLFVETQMAVDPALAASETPALQFFPRDALMGDATNKWAPNPAALRALVEESGFRALGAEDFGSRGYVAAEAVSDEMLDRFRSLDSSTGRFRNE